MFIDTFAERLMTYALGRGVEPYDHPVLRQESGRGCVRKPSMVDNNSRHRQEHAISNAESEPC